VRRDARGEERGVEAERAHGGRQPVTMRTPRPFAS
jgi:hypothetical protein